MAGICRIALLGFGAFERDALKSFFRTGDRPAAYRLTDAPADADWIVADADRADAVAAVRAAGREAATLYIGTQAPGGDAAALLPRPIEPLRILRELDARSGRAPSAAAAAPAQPIRPLELTVAVAVEPLDVLVVDDSEVAQRSLARLVRRLGLRPALAATSQQALERIARLPPAVVLLDVTLGADSEFDGLALCQQLKHPPAGSARPVPHVVLVSAATAAVDRVRGSLAGCDAYLAKPIDEAQLSATLAGLEPAAFGTTLVRSRPGQHRAPRR